MSHKQNLYSAVYELIQKKFAHLLLFDKLYEFIYWLLVLLFIRFLQMEAHEAD